MDKPISRREFLKLAGKVSAAVGLGAGLAGTVGGCSESDETAQTIATIVAGPTTTTTEAPATTTTVSTGPEIGRPLRLGLIAARTGPLALSGKAEAWAVDRVEGALAGGLLCGDGKLHEIRMMVQDSGSDPDQAARVAEELITLRRPDLLMSSGGRPAVAVATVAEAMECPCLCNSVLWQEFVFGRGATVDTPFTWTYAHAIGLEDVVSNYLAMWAQVETNKKVGFAFTDDPQGPVVSDAAAGLPAAASAAGYEVVAPAPLPAGSGDWTSVIAEMKADGCEICCGWMSAADLVDLWKQARRLEYLPKVVTVGRALQFPHALEAMGRSARGMTAEGLWHPSWPYEDSITGSSARELAADYQIRTGDQWTAAIAHYGTLEWAVDVFKRTRDVSNKRAVMAAVRATDLATCLGPIRMSTSVDTTDTQRSRRPAENIYKAPVTGVQWVPGDGFDFEPVIVSNIGRGNLPVTADVQPMFS